MGLFITLEGVEGCGKTTQIGLLKDYFVGIGIDALFLREPGGTTLGESIRKVLLDSTTGAIDPMAELFLYEACRAEIVATRIKPALSSGRVVVCDRFTDSTLAYQGHARGLDLAVIENLNEMACAGVKPDVTIVLDCAPSIGLKRANARMGGNSENREDRFEQEAITFHEKVRKGFLKIAAKEPERVRVVNAEREIPLIHKDICDIIKGLI